MRRCGQILHIYRFYSIKQNIKIPQQNWTIGKFQLIYVLYYLKCVCLFHIVNNEFVLESRDVIYDRIKSLSVQNKNAGPDLILLFTTFQAKGFPPTSAKCTENHWLVKDVSDSLPEKRNKKSNLFTPSHNVFIQLINMKLKIEKVINFFLSLSRKRGYRYNTVFIFYGHLLFFLSTPPKRKWLLLYPDEESESKNITRTKQ